MTLQHLRSSTANKRPTPAAMSDGQLAMNTNLASPGLFLKDSNGDLVKVGPVHVGTTAPNATPAVGGQAGNSKGEQWLDTTGGVYVFKIYDGTAWRSETGTFVDVNGDTMTGALGIIAGSAAAPGVFFSGDTNTGIYSPGADQVAVATNGVARLTTSTTAVSSSLAIDHPLGAVGTPSITFTGDLNTGLYSPAADTLAAVTAGSNRLHITSGGLVGIGTSSPGEKLTVAGNILLSAAQPYISFIDSTWGAGSTFRSGVNTLGTATGDYQLFNVPTGKGFAFAQNNATNSLVIDSSGNVGIGTTSPRFNLSLGTDVSTSTATPNAIDLGGTFSNTAGQNLKLRLYWDSNSTVAGLGVSATSVDYVTFANSAHTFYAGTTERARIDSSGRLLVGTSTYDGNARAVVQGNTSSNTTGALVVRYNGTRPLSAGESIGTIRFESTSQTNANYHYASISCDTDGASGSDTDIPGRLVFSVTADGAASPTERMRIDALGALKTSPNGTYKFPAGTTEITHNDATSSIQLIASSTSFTGDAVTISTYRNTVNDSYKFLSCIRQGFAVALEIRDDGDVYNVNGTYGSLSDVKLKENIVDANSQWDDIRQLRVRNYNFKPETNNSTHKQIGVIAQEIEDVSPGLVNTVPDRDEEGNDLGTVTKSVNYSVLYMKAVKALQEAMERIETLEARLTAAGIE